jgi:dethiobiotin synthetase
VKHFFITGTDTEIGKTFVTCGLLLALRGKGIHAAPMKPIAAGAVMRGAALANEDVHDLVTVYGGPIEVSMVNPYCFQEPIAPHIAAMHDGVAVDMRVIESAFTQLAASHDTVLVEGAGGFLVPLSNTESMSALPQRLGLEVLLVVGMRLGCLNHALLTAEAIRARGLRLAGWVANTVDASMSCFDENVESLTQRLGAACLGVVPRIAEQNLVARATATASHLNIEPLLVATV